MAIFLPIRRVLVGARTPFLLGVSLLIAGFWSEENLVSGEEDLTIFELLALANDDESGTLPPDVSFSLFSTEVDVTNIAGNDDSNLELSFVLSRDVVDLGGATGVELKDAVESPIVRGEGGSGAGRFLRVFKLRY